MKNDDNNEKVSSKEPSKVETIKSQLKDGNYKILDSSTLAKSFVKNAF